VWAKLGTVPAAPSISWSRLPVSLGFCVSIHFWRAGVTKVYSPVISRSTNSFGLAPAKGPFRLYFYASSRKRSDVYTDAYASYFR
jgi:hypothetical protein